VTTVTDPLIVVVEDEPQIRKFLKVSLESNGYRMVEADTAKQGISEAANHKPDLLIVDLGLPDMDGVEVVRQVREWSDMPIIVLSARSLESDKIAALDAGADDYLTKPFAVGELLARLRVAFRHASRSSKNQEESVFAVGELEVDLARRIVKVKGAEVHLTPIEYRLLSVLVKNAGRVVTHRQLLKEVWGPARIDQNHYLRIYMAILRQKLEAEPARPCYLRTEAGIGYRLADEC
jgi:two-component system, OmpR family, KDP operon response regulator KdpE